MLPLASISVPSAKTAEKLIELPSRTSGGICASEARPFIYSAISEQGAHLAVEILIPVNRADDVTGFDKAGQLAIPVVRAHIILKMYSVLCFASLIHGVLCRAVVLRQLKAFKFHRIASVVIVLFR